MTTTATTPTTLGRRAEQALERLGDGPSLFFEGTWHSAGELAGRARRAAAGLAGIGVRPGDRVVLCMTNCPEVGIAYTALWRAGAVPTPVLFLLTEPELRHVLTDSGARAVITTPEWLPKIQAAAPHLPVVVVGGEAAAPGTVAFADLESGEELPLVDRDVDDMAALLYTGGTTGRSKGVVLTHASLDTAGAAGMAASSTPGRVRGILPLPLAHAYGLMVSVAGLHSPERGASVLMRWFDPAGFLDLVEEHRVQTAALVPSMIQMLLTQPLEQRDLSCLERIGSGGAPLSTDVALEIERRIPTAEVREGYGCTETSALIATQPLEERRLGSVGKPIPAIELRIEGPDGALLPAGQDGEIVVRGPVLMQGYWQAPEETAKAVRDGWWHSGDVGHLDEDGWLYVVDRLKDLIIRNGFNVYPRDVEDVLLAHPDVTSAAVVGRPDPTVGEEVIAFVALHAGATVTSEELIAYTRQHLSAAKYPREVRIVDTVPVTSVFKTDRKALRALIKEEST
ncbi:MAG: Long-chain acyl-CoA synthetase [Frankiales bacterium]|nr:Long-chain acyl-CoA synthetase [Frankiales bacterium]